MTYAPPLRDINFVLDNVIDIDSLLAYPRYAEAVDRDTLGFMIEEVGRFMAEVVAPSNVDGDRIGATWSMGADGYGQVVTPESFRKAYKALVETGFTAAPFDPEFGGGGFPWLAAIIIQELMNSANMAFSLCPLLTQGAIDAIAHHGSEDQKLAYVPKMVTGEWTGSMNLTEPQAGSDVGALTTRAEPQGDGSFLITGQKIFITFGEHDLASNIIHLVLARTPGSPPGTKGISMFLVPKYLLDEQGNPGTRNDVSCVSIEHKLGIHGSPTCVLSFGDNGGAVGWLIGDENDGMRNMFTMMNNARLSVGVQGLSLSERAYQQALAYSRERIQGTAVGAPKGTKSPIIDHADVRRQLMTQRAWIDAMRCLLYENAAAMGRAAGADPEQAQVHQEWVDLLIPLSKSLCTDVVNEMTSLAIQVHGGMGYVEETGVAQHYRDARIAAIYEGTNGIQAADLVGRKLPMRGGEVVMECLERADRTASVARASDAFALAGERLAQATEAARESSRFLLANGADDPNIALAGSTPYLRLLGSVVAGSLLLAGAQSALTADPADEFHQAKASSARFFCEQILPTATALQAQVTAGPAELFALNPNQLGT